MNAKIITKAVVLLVVIALQACKHPLAIVGEGDIVDANNSGRGCTLEQFQATETACTENEVNGDYFVNYEAVPRPGWRFVRWDGPCSPDSDFQHCRLQIAKAAVEWWDKTYPDIKIPPSTAVFQPIAGETGYLVGGTAVAGVTYETPTQQGVTGLDGSFQYGEGETVRFMIGDTLLGEVTGRAQVTPFDLAGSPVLTGINITWGLQDESDPYHTVVNLAVLLHSLDDDGEPDNGIVIRAGVASLLYRIALDLRKPWDSVEARSGIFDFSLPYQPWLAFETDPTFRHVLGMARRQSRFSTPHGMAEPSASLASLYATLGIDADLVGLKFLRVSQRGESETIETLYYDANGNISRHENTQYGDAYEIWQYDEQGEVTRHELHASAFGQHAIDTWEYDVVGNLVRVETSPSSVWTYRYDDDGNMTQKSSIRDNYSAVVDFRYTFDELGRLQRVIANDGEGFNDWSFNELGKVVRHEKYYGYGSETSIYNSDGNITRHEGGYLPWSPEVWQYDAQGKLIRYEQQTEWCEYICYRMAGTWEYDESGRLVTRTATNLANNTVYEVDSWQYDESGRVISRVGDPLGGDETITETWQYHTNGQIKRHAIVSESGQYDDLEDLYDLNGNLVQEVIFQDNSTENWGYDAEGKLVVRNWDATSNGIPDQVMRYEYTTTGWAHLFSGIRVYGQAYRPPIKPTTKHEEKPPE